MLSADGPAIIPADGAGLLTHFILAPAKVKRCLRCEGSFDLRGWTCPHCGWQPVEGEFRSFGASLRADDYPVDAYDKWLPFEEANNFWFIPRSRMISAALGRYFPAASSFLEVGCGAGSILARLSKDHPTTVLSGCELDPAALRIARERVGGAELFCASAESIPFQDEFDAAGAFDVLEHIEDDGVALAGIVQSVRPGGGVLISVPQHRWLWSAEDEYAGHKRRYRRRDLRDLLAKTGLESVRMTSYVFAPLPAMAITRMASRNRDNFDQLEEGSKPPPGAAFLRSLLNAEVAAIDAGVSFPAGGSLFAVARKPR